MGENSKVAFQNSSFLAINAKGGESIRPKAKGSHHHYYLKKFKTKGRNYFNCILVSLKLSINIISFGICFKNRNHFKNPLDKLRGEFLQGELLFSQRKKHLKQGEKFQILKMLLEIIFLYLWLFAKEFEKSLPKGFVKTNKWCKCGLKC
jgi:hypothetical protein